MLLPSSSSQNLSQTLSSHRVSPRQEPEPSARPLKCLGPFRGTVKVTPPQLPRSIECLLLIVELQALDYESPDDGELSDDTISNDNRPRPLDFNRIAYESKVVDWRNDPRMKACQQEHNVAPSEKSGDSFASQDHHYASGVGMGTWMVGNPGRAHADTYYH